MPSAKYVIDIAAELTGDETSAELDALTSDMLAAGKNAEFFQQAIKQVSTDLQAAASMTADANTELAAARAEYKALENAAAAAMKAAENAALANAQAAAVVANDALSEGQAKYAQLEKAANTAAVALEKAGLKASGSVPIDTARRAAETAAALEAYVSELRALEDAATQANAAVADGGTVAREDARAAAEAAAAVVAYSSKLEALEAASTAAQDEQAKLAGQLTNVKKIAGHADKTIAAQAENFEKMAGAIASVGGPLGTLGAGVLRPVAGFAKLSGSMGSANAAAVLGVVGFAALTAAVFALTAAVAAGAVKLAVWAVNLADAKREAGLAREAFEAMNPGVAALAGTVDQLNRETGLSVPTLNGLTKSLLDAGVETERMADAMRVAALAEKGLGAGAAAQYVALEQAASDAANAVREAAEKSGGAVDEKLTQQLEAATAAASAFASRATSKLGGVVARQMQGVGATSDRLASNFKGLFDGLDTAGAAAGLSVIADMFDENSVAGKALKFLFESIFQPLIDNAETAAQLVEAFYLGLLIAATKIYIAVKPAIKAVADLFGFDEPSTIDWFATLTEAGEILAPILLAVAAVVGGVLLAAFLAIAPALAVTIATWYVLVKAVGLVVDAFVGLYNYLTQTPLTQIVSDIAGGFVAVFTNLPATLLGLAVDAFNGIVSYLTGVDLSEVGTNLMLGMVRGITGGIGAVVGAVKNAMSSAISAAKSVLGIHSPSKVFDEEIAGNMVAGTTNRLEESTPEVQAAMTDMVTPPPANDNALADGFAPSIIPDAVPEDTALRRAQLNGDGGTVIRMQPSAADNGGAARRPPGDDGSAGGGASAGGGGLPPGKYEFNFYGLPDAKAAQDSFGEFLTAAVQGDVAKLGGFRKVG